MIISKHFSRPIRPNVNYFLISSGRTKVGLMAKSRGALDLNLTWWMNADTCLNTSFDGMISDVLRPQVKLQVADCFTSLSSS